MYLQYILLSRSNCWGVQLFRSSRRVWAPRGRVVGCPSRWGISEGPEGQSDEVIRLTSQPCRASDLLTAHAGTRNTATLHTTSLHLQVSNQTITQRTLGSNIASSSTPNLTLDCNSAGFRAASFYPWIAVRHQLDFFQQDAKQEHLQTSHFFQTHGKEKSNKIKNK